MRNTGRSGLSAIRYPLAVKFFCILFLLVLMKERCAFGQSAPEDNTVYTTVDVQPDFPGGPDSMKLFIERHVKNPQKPKRNWKQKKVYISFIVNADGSLSDKKVMTGLTPECNREAFRVVSLMPKWNPARLNGAAVRTKWVVAVYFYVP